MTDNFWNGFEKRAGILTGLAGLAGRGVGAATGAASKAVGAVKALPGVPGKMREAYSVAKAKARPELLHGPQKLNVVYQNAAKAAPAAAKADPGLLQRMKGKAGLVAGGSLLGAGTVSLLSGAKDVGQEPQGY